MLAIAMVTFREGLEALLIIAISIVYFSSLGATNLVKAVIGHHTYGDSHK